MKILKHKFVNNIPDIIEDNVLYVSIEYETVIHNCACGCGNEVVTPLSPSDWSLTFNGETISLEPSIGSWSLECKSHYWITNNNVRWSHKYSSAEIEKVREVDLEDKLKYYDSSNSTSDNNSADELEKPHSGQRKFNLLDWLKQLFKIK
ncbi:hypothetical protein MAR621_00147 [Maribacter dokdonensis]|uniref:DUF6527 family protein n=1 Tax=Maribacter dokdonensis TaxID=320912 RepID=UPI001B120BCB|nr:DUF6527 family protein [Maribacter dokdonensis]CAG2535033.1 hypothetical protein MAR621_00147 [Maribacter dokdonensis]|tara:strand:- start:1534 stop:1980 length:447 start_codon:yes stop_codon:yes gene_type:complete